MFRYKCSVYADINKKRTYGLENSKIMYAQLTKIINNFKALCSL